MLKVTKFIIRIYLHFIKNKEREKFVTKSVFPSTSQQNFQIELCSVNAVKNFHLRILPS